jgi:hypothetical protein
VVKKLVKCANEIPSNGIFGSEEWSSFICPLQRQEDNGELSGDAQDFNAVARHLNQLSEGHGFTIIKAGGIKNSSMLYRCERSGRYQAKEGSAKGEVYTKKCECPWSIRVRRLEGPVTSKGDRAIVFEPGMHVIQYPEEDHNHEMKARLFLLGDSTSDLSYSDAEENQFWEMARSYFRKRLDQSEAHGCLWDHSPAFRKILEAKKLTPEKLYDRIRAEKGSKSPKSTACHDFIKFLLQQQQENDADFFVSYILDPITNSLVGVVWASGQMRNWGKLFTDLVIFDTTHDTNVFQFFLGMSTVEDSHGETLVTAVSVSASRLAFQQSNAAIAKDEQRTPVQICQVQHDWKKQSCFQMALSAATAPIYSNRFGFSFGFSEVASSISTRIFL